MGKHKPVSSLLRRLEEITATTPPDDADRHRRLLAARDALRPWLVYEGITMYRGQVNSAVLAALQAFAELPYPEFSDGMDTEKARTRWCTACGASVRWGRMGPQEYHDCKAPSAGWSDYPITKKV